MKLRVPLEAEHFSASWVTISFPKIKRLCSIKLFKLVNKLVHSN